MIDVESAFSWEWCSTTSGLEIPANCAPDAHLLAFGVYCLAGSAFGSISPVLRRYKPSVLGAIVGKLPAHFVKRFIRSVKNLFRYSFAAIRQQRSSIRRVHVAVFGNQYREMILGGMLPAPGLDLLFAHATSDDDLQSSLLNKLENSVGHILGSVSLRDFAKLSHERSNRFVVQK